MCAETVAAHSREDHPPRSADVLQDLHAVVVDFEQAAEGVDAGLVQRAHHHRLQYGQVERVEV